MKGIDIWSMLSGYWELFRDRDTFTKLWDAMIVAAREYGQNRSTIESGVLNPYITLRYEAIHIDADKKVTVVNNGGMDKGYAICNIGQIMVAIGGIVYTGGVDYSIDPGTHTITWITLDPPNGGEGIFMGDDILVWSGYLEGFYNTGLLDLDISVYTEPEWVIYACLKHLWYKRTQRRLNNITAILGGTPFSKYYAHMEDGGVINYAVVVSNDHELFIAEHELDGYVFIDEENNILYDGRYPEQGTSATLCHRANLECIDGVYGMIVRGESVGDYNIEEPSGELVAFGHNIVPEQPVFTAPRPVITALDYAVKGGESAITVSEDDKAIAEGVMTINYVKRIAVTSGSITPVSQSEIEVRGSNYEFEAGEQIVIEDEAGNMATCNILSGSYDPSSDKYRLRLGKLIDTGMGYTIIVIKHESALVPVVISDENAVLIIPFALPTEYDAFPYFTIAPGYVAASNTFTVSPCLSGVETITIDPATHDMAAGDTISITANGDQHYYYITAVNPEHPEMIRVSPGIIGNIEDVAVAVWNGDMGRNMLMHDTTGSPEIMNNKSIYMGIYAPDYIGHDAVVGVNMNSVNAILRSDRTWEKIGREATKTTRG